MGKERDRENEFFELQKERLWDLSCPSCLKGENDEEPVEIHATAKPYFIEHDTEIEVKCAHCQHEFVIAPTLGWELRQPMIIDDSEDKN